MAEALGGPLGRGRPLGRLWLVLGGLNGAIAIAVSASFAHGSVSDAGRLAEIGARYELLHAILLIGVSVAARLWSSRLIDWAGGFVTAGCVLFSGGLYLDAATGGAGAFLVPIGGAAFILGWLCLAGAGWRERAVP
jgi:uncharacterized membrane protein YgdD (TMEM256/DUF423 family)